jgi:hypothetical protein
MRALNHAIILFGIIQFMDFDDHLILERNETFTKLYLLPSSGYCMGNDLLSGVR